MISTKKLFNYIVDLSKAVNFWRVVQGHVTKAEIEQASWSTIMMMRKNFRLDNMIRHPTTNE
jgi:hypothetical protein